MEMGGGVWSWVEVGAQFRNTHCLFGAVKLSKNADLDKCKYIGYGTGFDSRSLTDGSDGKKRYYFWS